VEAFDEPTGFDERDDGRFDLKRVGAITSMDGEGLCIGNIFIERLWRSLKYECVDLHTWETDSQAKTGIGRWMTFRQSPAASRRPWRATACRGLLERH
jgi:hypothetical protein